MALESTAYVIGLVETNPPGTDSKSQGDDHLRLIKTVLKNTFPLAYGPLKFRDDANSPGALLNLTFFKNNPTPVNDEYIGSIVFDSLTNTKIQKTFARIITQVKDCAVNTEDANMYFQTMVGGVFGTAMTLSASGVTINDSFITNAGSFTTTSGNISTSGGNITTTNGHIMTTNGSVRADDGTAAAPGIRFYAAATGFFRTTLGGLGYSANGVELARYTSSAFLIGLSTSGSNTEGVSIFANGLIQVTRTANIALQCNRTNDGTVAQFGSAGSFEGNISISGATCTYGTFMGSHWSQLADNSMPEIKRGSIVETIDELCNFRDSNRKTLPRFKLSETEGTTRPYGVFGWWDEEQERAYIASLGAYVVRMDKDQPMPQGGDLIESAGNGCGRVMQEMDPANIVRCHVATITAAVVVKTYRDGSYLVPCTLHCG